MNEKIKDLVHKKEHSLDNFTEGLNEDKAHERNKGH